MKEFNYQDFILVWESWECVKANSSKKLKGYHAYARDFEKKMVYDLNEALKKSAEGSGISFEDRRSLTNFLIGRKRVLKESVAALFVVYQNQRAALDLEKKFKLFFDMFEVYFAHLRFFPKSDMSDISLVLNADFDKMLDELLAAEKNQISLDSFFLLFKNFYSKEFYHELVDNHLVKLLKVMRNLLDVHRFGVAVEAFLHSNCVEDAVKSKALEDDVNKAFHEVVMKDLQRYPCFSKEEDLIKAEKSREAYFKGLSDWVDDLYPELAKDIREYLLELKEEGAYPSVYILEIQSYFF